MKNLYLLVIAPLIFFAACKKSDFLDAKPDDSLVIPKTLLDYQAILDNNGVLNGTNSGINPAFGEAGADDYFILPTTGFSSLSTGYKNIYVWKDDIYDVKRFDWELPYNAIFYANTVLDGIAKLDKKPEEVSLYKAVKGRALFFRSEMLQNLTQIFAQPYDQNSAQSILGLPLKLRADINEDIERSNLKETYEAIIKDLKEASELLPHTLDQTRLAKMRPSKAAAFALLARTYQSMRQYDSAYLYSNKCLQLYDTLLDFNDRTWITPTATTGSVKEFNPEVIFHSVMLSQGISSLFLSSRLRVDSNLVASYNTNDWRRTTFFRSLTGGMFFKGGYTGGNSFFGGISTNEVYLIRAECLARKGNTNEAMADLNRLLKKRWKNTVTYTNLVASDANDALAKVLIERRKELLFRGLRWMDLRRLNKDGANITITRIMEGQTYTLAPNSLHYTYLIPPDVIGFHPQMQQNPR